MEVNYYKDLIKAPCHARSDCQNLATEHNAKHSHPGDAVFDHTSCGMGASAWVRSPMAQAFLGGNLSDDDYKTLGLCVFYWNTWDCPNRFSKGCRYMHEDFPCFRFYSPKDSCLDPYCHFRHLPTLQIHRSVLLQANQLVQKKQAIVNRDMDRWDQSLPSDLCRKYSETTKCTSASCHSMHQEYPCEDFYVGAGCKAGPGCRFWHGPVPNEEQLRLIGLMKNNQMKPSPAQQMRHDIYNVPLEVYAPGFRKVDSPAPVNQENVMNAKLAAKKPQTFIRSPWDTNPQKINLDAINLPNHDHQSKGARLKNLDFYGLPATDNSYKPDTTTIAASPLLAECAPSSSQSSNCNHSKHASSDSQFSFWDSDTPKNSPIQLEPTLLSRGTSLLEDGFDRLHAKYSYNDRPCHQFESRPRKPKPTTHFKPGAPQSLKRRHNESLEDLADLKRRQIRYSKPVISKWGDKCGPPALLQMKLEAVPSAVKKRQWRSVGRAHITHKLSESNKERTGKAKISPYSLKAVNPTSGNRLCPSTRESNGCKVNAADSTTVIGRGMNAVSSNPNCVINVTVDASRSIHPAKSPCYQFWKNLKRILGPNCCEHLSILFARNFRLDFRFGTISQFRVDLSLDNAQFAGYCVDMIAVTYCKRVLRLSSESQGGPFSKMLMHITSEKIEKCIGKLRKYCQVLLAQHLQVPKFNCDDFSSRRCLLLQKIIIHLLSAFSKSSLLDKLDTKVEDSAPDTGSTNRGRKSNYENVVLLKIVDLPKINVSNEKVSGSTVLESDGLYTDTIASKMSKSIPPISPDFSESQINSIMDVSESVNSPEDVDPCSDPSSLFCLPDHLESSPMEWLPGAGLNRQPRKINSPIENFSMDVRQNPSRSRNIAAGMIVHNREAELAKDAEVYPIVQDNCSVSESIKFEFGIDTLPSIAKDSPCNSSFDLPEITPNLSPISLTSTHASMKRESLEPPIYISNPSGAPKDPVMSEAMAVLAMLSDDDDDAADDRGQSVTLNATFGPCISNIPKLESDVSDEKNQNNHTEAANIGSMSSNINPKEDRRLTATPGAENLGKGTAPRDCDVSKLCHVLDELLSESMSPSLAADERNELMLKLDLASRKLEEAKKLITKLPK